MAKYELKLPKMGESVAEATITNWIKNVGDKIEEDEAVLEIATDKVDSEVPSEVEGVLKEILFEVDEIVKVGQTIAILEIEGEAEENENEEEAESTISDESSDANVTAVEDSIEQAQSTIESSTNFSESSRFYSPLVKSIAKKENISLEELENIKGTGKNGRVTKNDMLAYVNNRAQTPAQNTESSSSVTSIPKLQKVTQTPISFSGEDEIIEMTRMGKIISNHMTASVQTSAHVQSFIEVDVTKIWNWRNKVKGEFLKREGQKFTFTPIFMQTIAKALTEFPMMNISVDSEKQQIIKRKHINLGMATALADGNLIVPVIKDANELNLIGMAKRVNTLAEQARTGKLSPDATSGGTYTVTNVGSFGSVMGTPIINQPQVGILALGAIRKTPSVIETPEGDFIGIRHKMFLSHSYDHRVVNGALGSRFIQRIKELLENFDDTQTL